jgi:diaminohydroxyphosphoribosylaminopyrimidine deaminase / 5-amino-6-(5-phosphoribosylamino)uracil reductase
MSFTEQDELFLRRAWVLARRAWPLNLGTNPPVGAVIAEGSRILSEGWHQAYGGPHAEIEALRRLPPHTPLTHATLYVTLEPCCHYGKTPPCTSAILSSGPRRVVIGTIDPNPLIAGQGIAQLQEAGLQVLLSPNPKPYQRLIRRFAVSIREKRPYITLKWAELRIPDLPPVLGSRDLPQYPISTFWGRVWGHRLRSQHSHIAVGYATWRLDQPRLTTRLFPGSSPQPIVLYDPRRGQPQPEPPCLTFPLHPLHQTLHALYSQLHVGSLLVEGGAQTLQAFLSSGLYDEIHILTRWTNRQPPPKNPVWAPTPPPHLPFHRFQISPNEIVSLYRRPISW